MSYCTINDIKKHIPVHDLMELTDDEGLGQINQARVDEAISQADAEIDAYCGGRYIVPLSPTPEIAKKLSVDIALYNLFSRVSSEVPVARSERYKSAIRQLEGISRGRISLGSATAVAEAESTTSAEINRTSADNVFSRKSMEGF